MHTQSLRIEEGLSALTYLGLKSEMTRDFIRARQETEQEIGDDDQQQNDQIETSLLDDMDEPTMESSEGPQEEESKSPSAEEITLLILGVKTRVTGLRLFNSLEITTPLINSIGSVLITVFVILYNLVGNGKFVPPA
eukprot:TRINITY_DN896_c0_g1_i2.p1 TRINITY_DN896_c0_g1~~TRINITY_DN896_c0_g1_i2.p1  ORF type:complete len:137 (-),score=55.80 TRINITY_DN896_c0_g1_i2:89-499(-)